MSTTTSSADGPGRPSRVTGRGQLWGKKAGLVGAGLLAGGILAGTISATAATSPTPAPSPSSSPSGSSTGDGHRAQGTRLALTGTVTGVGPSTVTIKTSSATTTYTLTSDSDIDKNGEAKLSNLVVGDAVRFSTTTTNGTTIDKLHAGDEAKNLPSGGMHGRRGHGLALSGTVQGVAASTVTIKTSSGTTTYSVTGSSDIDKNGEAKLSDLVVGDAVRFSTTTTNGTTIDRLHAGDETKNRPQGQHWHGGPTSG